MADVDIRYRVVFSGGLTGEFDEAETKARLKKAFKLSDEHLARCFSGKPVTLKSNLGESDAMNFMVKLTEIGCEPWLEELPDENDPTLDPDFVERRKAVRRLRFRRGPRPGAIVPDRRKLPSRRRADLIMLEKYGDFPGKTVGPDGSKS